MPQIQTPRRPGRDPAGRPRRAVGGAADSVVNPWNALWAMMVGFFMILVDATIVAVANPSIMTALGADYNAVIWVTSAYLLAYAVPLLLAGRLGDRFGPKNLYLAGLAVFTVASLWCGLAGSIEMLIAARVLQGVGAALLTPQTLSTITRIFPAERRGAAMSVWGATAGVATLVGPLAGGVLVDGLGWQWVFIVNVPIGIVGLALAFWLVPELPTHKSGFDFLGVALSGIGMFLIVFALQEGQSHDWAPWIWATIVGGIGFMTAFVYWQATNRGQSLIPLAIFRDRDFSLSNVGVATIGFVVTGMILPLMFYAQAVCGLSPTRSALLTAPMAIATGLLAPVVGKIVDRVHPSPIVGFGFSALAIGLTWLTVEMQPDTPIWRLVLPITALGVGMAFIWSPLATTATRNLPTDLAGAGSGVYNTTRQVGAVLGSGSMAAFMSSRINAEMPPTPAGGAQSEGPITALPEFLHGPFAAAMSQAMLLPAFVALFGVVAALFLLGFSTRAPSRVAAPSARRAGGTADRTQVLAAVPGRADGDHLYSREYAMGHGAVDAAGQHGHYGPDVEFIDDDHYAEYVVDWGDPQPEEAAPEPATGPLTGPAAAEPAVERPADPATEPLPVRSEHVLPAPATSWHPATPGQWEHRAPAEPEPEPPRPEPDAEPEPWRGLLDDLIAGTRAKPGEQPIRLRHNGFDLINEQRNSNGPASAPDPLFGDLFGGDHAFGGNGSPANGNGSAAIGNGDATNGRHSRAEDDDPLSYGRHSRHRRD